MNRVPTPEELCEFVKENYGQYEGAYLCGKASEILVYLLKMAGYHAEKVSVKIDGVGHIFVRCQDLNLDPTIKQFGDYLEVTDVYPLTISHHLDEDGKWLGLQNRKTVTGHSLP